ncbi:MAG: TIGR04282 family arsenosugar biosynthesis glycosyltransferase [Flavobacteriales bacterium]|nr:TIGR04282 family arsenosugar biosynthesis glycosyltransferase [Flavobacteriales bacterium]
MESESESRSTLMVFVKSPVAGTVKTRLAASIGDAEALSVYERLLRITLNAAEGCGKDIRKMLWYSGEWDGLKKWNTSRFEPCRQPEGDLGERMDAAFRDAFRDGASKAVIIGSDCPYITAHVIEEAFDMLDHHDVVIGPSMDGGYYLLGSTAYHPWIFEGMPWSSSGLLEQTIKAVSGHGRRYRLLHELQDVDTEEDLVRWQNDKTQRWEP